MGPLRNVPLSLKIFLGFFVMTVLVVAVGLLGLQSIKEAENNLREIDDSSISRYVDVTHIEDSINTGIIFTLEYVYTGEEAAKNSATQHFSDAQTALIAYGDSASTENERALSGDLERSLALVLDANDTLITAFESGPSPADIENAVVALRMAQEVAQETVFKEVDNTIIESRDIVIQGSQGAVSSTFQLGIGLLVVTFFVAIILAFVLARGITSSIAYARNIAVQMSSGNLDTEIQARSKDEVGQLVSAFETMRRNIKEILDSKNEFVAIVSHQLRTPLTVVRGNIELLQNQTIGPLNQEQERIVDDVLVGSIKLIKLVNETLDIAKIESGDLDLETRDILLHDILGDLAVENVEKAKAKGIELFFTPAPRCTPVVQGDIVRLKQVFQNITDNAINYTNPPCPQGCKVNISTACEGKKVEIHIADTGIGIPEKEREHIFTKFFRASNAKKFVNAGTGLGLHIAHQIVLQHGGTISFYDNDWGGTTFVIGLTAKST